MTSHGPRTLCDGPEALTGVTARDVFASKNKQNQHRKKLQPSDQREQIVRRKSDRKF